MVNQLWILVANDLFDILKHDLRLIVNQVINLISVSFGVCAH